MLDSDTYTYFTYMRTKWMQRKCGDKPYTCLACLNGFNTFESLIPMELCAKGLGKTQTCDPGRQIASINQLILDPWTHRRRIYVKTRRFKFTCTPFESRCASSFVRASLACQVRKIYQSVELNHHQWKLGLFKWIRIAMIAGQKTDNMEINICFKEANQRVQKK